MAISMKELNLEQGMPTVDTALRWLEAELHAARKMGRPGLKLIHGYGSSGTGGKIRTACRKYLREQAEAALGEDFVLKDFHKFLLDIEPAPFYIIEQSMADWMEAR